MGRMHILVVSALAAALLPAAVRDFEVDGVLDPPAEGAPVVLSDPNSTVILRASTDSKGRFHFRKLQLGTYTIWASVPGRLEALETVEVGISSSDAGGRVPVTIRLGSPDAMSYSGPNPHLVSVQELSIPDSARKEYNAAMKLLGQNRGKPAADRLSRAVAIAPQFWAAWNELGVIAYREARFSEAEADFRRAHEAAPKAFDPVSNLGGVLLNLGRYPEALQFNTAALEQRPNDALVNSQTGLNYYLMNQLDKAVRYLKIAKRLDPFHFTHPQRFLADIYVRLSKRAAARSELEDFVARHPDLPEADAARRRLAELR